MSAFQDDGIQDCLDALTGTTPISTALLRLFSNNVTPDNTTTLGGLTEATFTGYAAVTLSGWSAASLAAHVASSTANPITFTLTAGSQNIYGWYVTSADGELICAGRDVAAPVAMSLTVNTYQVTLTISLAS
jgi:hypothetical protein